MAKFLGEKSLMKESFEGRAKPKVDGVFMEKDSRLVTWLSGTGCSLIFTNAKVLVRKRYLKAENGDAESSGPSRRTACCRSWPTPASSLLTASHLTEVRPTLALSFLRELQTSGG